MRNWLVLLIVLLSPLSLLSTEPCQEIHGRARLYTGDGQLMIWQTGTHHEFWILDDKSWDQIFKCIPAGGGKDLYADFTPLPHKKVQARCCSARGGEVREAPCPCAGTLSRKLISLPENGHRHTLRQLAIEQMNYAIFRIAFEQLPPLRPCRLANLPAATDEPRSGHGS